MKIIFFLLLTAYGVSAQVASAEHMWEAERKNPVKFTHVPFLLLRVNPSHLLGYNNTFQVGAEVAPPIGKLSFAFDYGWGKGKYNLNKQVRTLQPENLNKELRGEIRAYFSDWFPFYALDKKPFGRYYALEYVNGTYDRNLGVSTGGTPVSQDGEIAWIYRPTQEKTHVIHVKFGRHLHLHRHLFLDVYGGIGVGKSTFTSNGIALGEEGLYNPAKMDFLTHKRYASPASKQYFFSKTLGVRIVVPI